ncbi:hypothetical protein, partial [Caldifermentibacillus hisashii]|uniref:hypothetical protein n=1 Tax=Caldifermentibacillus hisashii TaxID=996558 RepID=UPI002E024AD0|nr:hypothetical protein [Caldifermentibacillus hisashii]
MMGYSYIRYIFSGIEHTEVSDKQDYIKRRRMVVNRSLVSPHSNNAYKSTAPLVKIDISIKGGAFHMPEQKLTIVPVTLHS